MSQEITVGLRVPRGEKNNIPEIKYSITINQDSTLRDMLVQDFKKDKWVKFANKNAIGVLFVFNRQKIGSESLDKKLSDLKIGDGSALWIVFVNVNPRIMPTNLIKFDFFEKNNDLLPNSTTNNLEINGKHQNKNKDKKSNIKRRSKLRITLAVLDVLSFIAFIITICFHVITVVSVVLFVALLILTVLVIDWNNIVSKDYQDIPCGFSSCCPKKKSCPLSKDTEEIPFRITNSDNGALLDNMK